MHYRRILMLAIGSIANLAMAQTASTLAKPAGPNARPIAVAQASRATAGNLLTYVLTNNPQTGAVGFGAVDLTSGGFAQIGGALPWDLGHALLPSPGTPMLSLAFSGKLYSIEPRTGAASVVGATGLADCTTPVSPCGPTSANTIGELDGRYYALDFSQNLYSLDPATGATKLIGPTGIPQITVVPLTIDASTGKLNVFDENLFSFRGKLYANFDTGLIDLSNGSETAVIPAALHQIDPATGHSMTVAPTDVGLLTMMTVNDTIYAFDAPNGRFVTVDPSTGQTKPVSYLDPSAGLVCGATSARPAPSVRP
jgi:hypothetical protein